jgi:precorrin-6B methylase 2
MELEEVMVKIKEAVNPERIMDVGMGFLSSKILLTAVNMDLFTFLASGPKSVLEIKGKLRLHDRSLFDFLDTLVALGFLKREGLKETSMYSNTEDTDFFLDRNKPSYVGGIMIMANHRLYKFWDRLQEALETGKPQNELKHSEKTLFHELYADNERLREFINAMAGAQMGNFITFAHKFNFSPYSTLCDMGGAGGFLAAHVAINNPHMKVASFDLPQVEPIARENMSKMNLTDRVKLITGDFFNDPFPKADIITMGNILHDWSLEDKKLLIRKAYDALPEGGAFVAIENVIDSDRRENAFGLIMSLNMLIETDSGFDYTVDEFEEWVKEAGFCNIEIMPLEGAASAAIAYK